MLRDFDEDDAAGGRRGRGDDVEALIAALDGFAVFDLVGGEVFGGDETSSGLFEGGDLLGHCAFVEGGGVFGDGVRVAASSGCLKISPSL